MSRRGIGLTPKGGWCIVRAVGLLALAGAFLAGSSAAACVPQPLLITVEPRSSGPPGTEATVTALGFDPGRAEIRWNTSQGELLASANGPGFSAKVTIPQVPQGLYHLIVLGRSPAGAIGNTGSVAFEVTSASGPTPSTVPVSAENASQSTNTRFSDGAVLSAAVGTLVSLGFLSAVEFFRRRPQAVPHAPVEPHGE